MNRSFRHTSAARHIQRQTRRQSHRRAAYAATGLLMGAALLAQGSIMSSASWSESEWVHGAAGTSNCTTPEGAFANRAEGRALSGDILDINLDSVAEASGVEVTNDGTRSRELLDVATPLGDDAYANPLNVEALSLLNVNLGRGLLQLPLDNGTGVIGQYGQAHNTGEVVGASGYVTSSGGIATNPDDNYPDLATLQVSKLIDSLAPSLGTTLGNVADVELEIGAVSGRAQLDGCEHAWSGDLIDALNREYLTSHVRTTMTSPTVGALVTAVSNDVAALQTTVNGLSSNDSVLSAIKTGATGLVNGVLGLPGNIGLGVSLGNVQVESLSASINLAPVNALLTQPFGDAGGIVRVHPSTGHISIDTGTLLAAAYPGTYGAQLNNLPPNTELLVDAHVVNTLTAALGTALDDWLTQVNAAITGAINAISLNVSVTIDLRIVLLVLSVPLAKITATTSGTLASLTTGTTTQLFEAAVPILDSITSALVSGLGGVVQSAVNSALTSVRSLTTTTLALTQPIVTAVSTAYSALHLDGIISLKVNAQNDPLTGLSEPTDWSGFEEGRYEVAAMRVGVLEALSSGVRLYLGRASVGPPCSQAQVAAGECANY